MQYAPLTSTPRFLILLASHNGAKFIRTQLLSILQQEGVSVQVRVRDDASSDATVEVVRDIQDARVQVQSRPTPSGSAATNFANLIREADSEGFDYVALSDQDDIWLPQKLARAGEVLRNTGAEGYSCSALARWPDGREALLKQSPHLRDADFLFEGAGQGCTFVLTATLFRRVQSLFHARKDLTQQLIYHDWAIYAVARALKMRWVFDPTPHIIYRQHGSNDTGARYSLRGIRRRIDMFRNGHYRLQISTICGLCRETSPEHPLLQEWTTIESGSSPIKRKLEKAWFSLLYGRRRTSDRIVTAIGALLGWI